MALDSCCLLPPTGWDWEPRNKLAADEEGIHHDAAAADDDDDFLAMCVESSSEASGGYREDAATHWSDRCKRQRTAPPPLPRCPATVHEDLQCLLQTFWDSGGGEGDLLHAPEMTILETSSFVSEEDDASGREQEQQKGPCGAGGQRSAAQRGEEEEEEAAGPPPPRLLFSATGQLQAAAAAPRTLQLLLLQEATTGAAARRRSSYSGDELPPSSSPCSSLAEVSRELSCNCSSSKSQIYYSSDEAATNCGSIAGKGDEEGDDVVLCPFTFVKPLGLEGGGAAALKDVNRRILKRPARPVRHPVGRFACCPAVSAAGRVGLSGKAVVGLTRIRTGGKGTVTIIRTRG